MQLINLTVCCPACKIEMPWTPQPQKTLVRCMSREITSWTRDHQPQQGITFYGTTDHKQVWYETYWVDKTDHVPSWYCGRLFIVRATRKE